MQRNILFLLSFMLLGSSLQAMQESSESIAEQGQKYVLTPAKSTVYPTVVYRLFGDVEGEEELLQDDGKAAVLRYQSGGEKPYVILDMGRASASGYSVFRVKSHKGTPIVRLAYSTHPDACGEEGGFARGSCTYLGVDLPVLPGNPGRYELYSIPRDGVFIAPLIQGQERYVRLQLDSENTEVEIDSFCIVNKDVHDMSPTTGHFLCNDETINQIWYASAWTLQIASFPNHNAWTNLNGWLIPRKLEHANDVGLSKDGSDWKDYAFDFDFEIRANPDHLSHAGWAFRATDEDNCYVAAIDLNGQFSLLKREGGKYTSLKQIKLKSKIIDGSQHHIRVVLKGKKITTFLDGAEIDNTIDATFSAGRVGFWHPKEKWFLVDNVQVSAGKELLSDRFSGSLDKWEFARTLSFISDGAKRDRLVWSGDLDWAGRNVYYAFDSASYMRDSLNMLAFNQTPEGYVHAAPYPENDVPPISGNYSHFASDEFSAWLIPVAWDYLLYTGDEETLRELYPAIRKDIEYLIGYVGEDGLFNQRKETSKHAGNLTPGDIGKRSYINILIQDSLKKTAMIAEVLGRDEDVRKYSEKAKAMKDAIMQHLWNEKEGYFQESRAIDGFYHAANGLALSTKLVTPQQAARIQDHMGRHNHGKFQSLMIRGKFEYGFGNAAMHDFFAHGWPELVRTTEVPLTVTECMTPKRGGWGDESHPDTAMAHIFTGYVLGVQPTKPGYASYMVKPHLTESITWAKGIVPIPKGKVVCSWKLEPKQFTYNLISPKGTNATIALPIAGLDDYKVSVNGKSIKRGVKGIGKVEAEGGYLFLRDVQPGTYTCIVEALGGSYAIRSRIAVSTMANRGDVKWNVTASSSHEEGGWGLGKIIDGITASKPGAKGFSSNASDSADGREWIEIDLGEKTSLKSIILYPRTDIKAADGRIAGFPVDLTVYTKSPGGTYEVIKTATNIPNPKGMAYTIDLYTVVGFPHARNIRIEVTKFGLPAADEPHAYRLQLAEMEIILDK